MSMAKNVMNNKMKILRKRPYGYRAINRGGFILLIFSLMLMVSLATAAPPTLKITIETFSPHYSPKIVRIGMGTPVSWDNPTSRLHSITHDGCKNGEKCAFDSGAIGPNGTFTLHHLPPGTYPYHCSFHPIMQGILVVLDSVSPSET